MAKIKLTKNELKTQRDALKRYQRYLPTLLLKKQQLQLEIRQAREAFSQLEETIRAFEDDLKGWVAILSQDGEAELADFISVRELRVGTRNIAGIDTPEFQSLEFVPAPIDFFTTPVWFDDALDAVRKTIEWVVRRQLQEEQLQLVEQELRVVTQRVNLFEKVKIPEAKDNIRSIQISLGDRQTSAVGRAKIAKEKCRARDLQPATAE